ncbi:MAG: GNAT family N-acetyltransferase [Chloroflexota bacterium]|jgi:GNAT superfamily N-acetyltransferase
MAAGLQIRDAREDDQEAIKKVTLAAFEQYRDLMDPTHWQAYLQSVEDTLAEKGPEERIVAELSGAIVGSVLLCPAGTPIRTIDGRTLIRERPEVRLLAVAPEARGRGIGAALVEECVRRARLAGAKELTLHTSDMMQAAVRLYERLGFVRAPELDFSPAPGVLVKGYSLSLDPEPQ